MKMSPVPIQVERPVRNEAPARRASLLWPLAEGGLMLLGLLLADWLLTGGTRFAGVEPHPFGFPVLLVAAQYGTGQGAAIALLAIAARYAGAWPEQGFGEDTAAYFRALTTSPLLWLGIALVVGGISGRLRGRVARAEAATQRARSDLNDMVEANTRLADSLSILEGKVAGQLRTVSAITEAARDLGPGLPQVLRGAPTLLRVATECQRCSLYLLDGGVLRLAGMEGWADGAPQATEIARGPLYEAIVERRAVLAANKAEDRIALQGQGMLAGPVLSSATGAVLGMLKIEEIGFARLSFDTVSNLHAVCSWVGTAIDHARTLSEAEEERFTVEGGRIIASRHAHEMTNFVTRLARRIGFDLALLSLDMEASAPPDGAGAVDLPDATALHRLLERQFRTSDLLLQIRSGHCGFGVLLPGAGRAGAQVVLERFGRDLRTEHPELAGRVALSCTILHDMSDAQRRVPA
jgi:hypothetical protein